MSYTEVKENEDWFKKEHLILFSVLSIVRYFVEQKYDAWSSSQSQNNLWFAYNLKKIFCKTELL